MTFHRPIIIAIFAGMLAACSVFQSQPAAVVRQQSVPVEHGQLQLQLASGVYRCEFGRSVKVQRDARNANLIEVSWEGRQRTLLRYDSASGLPRYEDRQNGLLWIDLPWKSVLMDVNTGRPLANECKLA